MKHYRQPKQRKTHKKERLFSITFLSVARIIHPPKMGQSPPVVLGRVNSLCDSFTFLSSSAFISGEGFRDQIAVEIVDYTAELPDECLAFVFQFLGPGDRNRCSLVCKRWFRVDGWSRHRLSLNAQSEIVSSLPSLFTRFDSVTKLALRCSRKSISLTDDSLLTISIRCRNLTRLKLRGCREITDEGMSTFAKNSKKLRKLSCGSCMFGAKALNAVLDHCANLEELSVKRLRGIHDGAEPIGPGAAASSLKMICLKELVNGQSFAPLVVGSKNLKTLKIIHCLGDWDSVLQLIGNRNQNYKENLNCDINYGSSDSNSNPLMEIHLERLQVSDIGLSAISKCTKIENLHIVKTPECSNYGLVCVAENCKLLRKLHIDGWRTNRIGDEGLIAVAKHCSNLQELVLIGVNATHVSLSAIACNCSKLERLALCGSGTIGDTEIACIAAKCMALKKLCIKGCPISDIAIEALGSGCPNLVKIKVRKCRGVSSDAGEWLREQRGSMLINMDACDTDCGFEASVSDIGVHETGVEVGQVTAVGASTSSNDSC
ncbi:F-box SKIP2 -like protein [Gossypium arboreum]|uniref:F-box SKIP2-like protein n=1 Tax=Gossypium arboreum TaxID=29729 RepID=A0A0B0MYW0_GOSAR|nr:F-box SKIP2 -like protein [Gossypium arboreum]KHG14150.1 F-box SKIP2 -like protein [Gossypium arboreum]KHG16724.1 F-box SKIP2 -like protein [Gossypium arboreum]